MNRKEIMETVREEIIAMAGHERFSERTQVWSLGLDSIDRVQLEVNLESIFNIRLDDDFIHADTTVGDIAEEVLTALNAKR